MVVEDDRGVRGAGLVRQGEPHCYETDRTGALAPLARCESVIRRVPSLRESSTEGRTDGRGPTRRLTTPWSVHGRRRGLVPSAGQGSAALGPQRRPRRGGRSAAARAALERGCTATFFVLGWIAERHPELVGRSRRRPRGRVARHLHRPLGDARRPSSSGLSNGRSRPCRRGAPDVIAYRAPYFSLERSTEWACQSCTSTASGSTAACSRCERATTARTTRRSRHTRLGPHPQVPELTLPTFGGLPCSVTGGFYSRLFPRECIGASRSCAVHSVMPVFYVHPWELDSAQPKRWAGAFPPRSATISPTATRTTRSPRPGVRDRGWHLRVRAQLES